MIRTNVCDVYALCYLDQEKTGIFLDLIYEKKLQ